eukprot:gnl/TRDRNA2_/TRDRNA2_171080_c3_seq2.p1 gnl/TRDRNA2_/TRDRNA2_171080_c3~~gnl/TRDRNA2_/TRDRNA2_171080_c3_seq2.p1  ORF type:complete len:1010 (+),score=212.84 gnl/TRDRNA2_/TRDRNA2_171080_c3_seq2:273-3032(+)
MVQERAKAGKSYGVVLIPEGLVDFIPEMSGLIHEINEVLGKNESATANLAADPTATIKEFAATLSPANKAIFEYLPKSFQIQLLQDRDPHGNVQVAKIESERLFALLTEKELKARDAKVKFQLQCHYFGYEGRCAPPTDFDCKYCYTLGLTAGALLGHGYSGMMASVRGLYGPVEDWKVNGMPLTHMMNVERRKGKDKPVIRKALTELEGNPFKAFCEYRQKWRLEDAYRNPGPTQFGTGTDKATFTLRLEQLGVDKVREALLAPGDLQKLRNQYRPELPSIFSSGSRKLFAGETPLGDAMIQTSMTHTGNRPLLEFRPASEKAVAHATSNGTPNGNGTASKCASNLRIGVVFSGRQTPGAHTCVGGIKRFLELNDDATRDSKRRKIDESNKHSNGGGDSTVIGFIGGTKGLFSGEHKEITASELEQHMNSGGLEMLGRTADVIRGPEHVKATIETCKKLRLDGLCVLGGSISMCDAGLLAEELKAAGLSTKVIGMPATIDGDLKGEYIDASVGFDTACRVYSSLVGNLQTDAASASKYYYFIRLMGRSPSQIALECALQTQPNFVLLGEELEAERMTLRDVIDDLADVVQARQKEGKNFGVVLIPDGLIEYIPELRTLLREVSDLYKKGVQKDNIYSSLSGLSKAMVDSMPEQSQLGLLQEPESSTGSTQLSQIESERLLADLVSAEMLRRKKDPNSGYKGNFTPVCFYMGYQARSALPSNFDCNLAYAIGCTAGALIADERDTTGYLVTVKGLTGSPQTWRCGAAPISALLSTNHRNGENVAAFPPALVDPASHAFQVYAKRRTTWQLDDCYRNPGPLQFMGPTSEMIGQVLKENHETVERKRQQVDDLLSALREQLLGSSKAMPSVLDVAVSGLQSLTDVIQVVSRTEDFARSSRQALRRLRGGTGAPVPGDLLQS